MTRLTGTSLRCRVMPLALAAAFTITACSSPDDNAADRPTASTASPTPSAPTSTSAAPPTAVTTSASSRDAELSDAVSAFWKLFVEVGGRTAPFDPERTRQRLAEITTGKELNRLLAVFSNNAAAGYVIRGAIDVAPTVVSVNGATAKVRDCYDDTTGLYRIADGSRIDTDDPERHQVLMTFVREDNTWKVSTITDRGMGCRV